MTSAEEADVIIPTSAGRASQRLSSTASLSNVLDTYSSTPGYVFEYAGLRN
ncbi:Uncharacterised protein [Mycobacteroides abscessus]|nr:Uncharacterised protein [Mycobacteroides abscessus]